MAFELWTQPLCSGLCRSHSGWFSRKMAKPISQGPRVEEPSWQPVDISTSHFCSMCCGRTRLCGWLQPGWGVPISPTPIARKLVKGECPPQFPLMPKDIDSVEEGSHCKLQTSPQLSFLFFCLFSDVVGLIQ